MRKKFLTLVLLSLMFWSWAEPPTFTREGRLESLQRGLDSFSLRIGERTYRRPNNLDGLPSLSRQWLTQRLAHPQGKTWPSYVDVGSRIRLLGLSDSQIAVEYKVLQPGPCWLVIVGSHRTRPAAERAARHLGQQGLSIECLESALYPPLKPGYWVCIGAAAPAASEASLLCQQLRNRGLKDAYVKGIHLK